MQKIARRFTTDGINADICTHPIGHLFNVQRHVVHLFEIDDFTLGKFLDKVKPVFHMVHHDHSARTQQPSRPVSKNANWPCDKHRHRFTLLNVRDVCGLVAGGIGIGR